LTDHACPCVEDDGGSPFAFGVHVQAIAADVDLLSDGRILLLEAGFGPRGCGEENASRNGE
jgi:hypothetical protein